MIETTPRQTVLINESPRPRLLVLGFKNESGEFKQQILALAPTSEEIEDIDDVRQTEWDVIVTDAADMERIDPELCVIYVAPYGNESITISRDQLYEVILHRYHVSRELLRYKDLPSRIQSLVHQQLEPLMRVRTHHEYFVSDWTAMGTIIRAQLAVDQNIRSDAPDAPPTLESFISSADGKALAGRYQRSSKSEAWLLPSDTPDVVSWVRTALAEWNAIAPDRFPGIPDWSEEDSWLTENERRILSELAATEAERVRELARLATRERELKSELAAAQEEANNYERSLLTMQGEPLKQAVIRALDELGFQVSDADLEAEKRRHLEDLLITDPSATGWVSLGEVKGFTKGASTSGIIQFIRFSNLYIRKHGREPDALWYIVNQFIGQDPSTRQPVLHGMTEDVEAFVNNNGLIIDTVTLFALLMRVRAGDLSSEKARARLRESKGRFEL